MNSDLIHAVERFGIKEAAGQDDCIDDKLHLPLPPHRTKRDPEAIKRQLEAEFLTPPTSFGPEWLNRLQQYASRIEAQRPN